MLGEGQRDAALARRSRGIKLVAVRHPYDPQLGQDPGIGGYYAGSLLWSQEKSIVNTIS